MKDGKSFLKSEGKRKEQEFVGPKIPGPSKEELDADKLKAQAAATEYQTAVGDAKFRAKVRADDAQRRNEGREPLTPRETPRQDNVELRKEPDKVRLKEPSVALAAEQQSRYSVPTGKINIATLLGLGGLTTIGGLAANAIPTGAAPAGAAQASAEQPEEKKTIVDSQAIDQFANSALVIDEALKTVTDTFQYFADATSVVFTAFDVGISIVNGFASLFGKSLASMSGATGFLAKGLAVVSKFALPITLAHIAGTIGAEVIKAVGPGLINYFSGESARGSDLDAKLAKSQKKYSEFAGKSYTEEQLSKAKVAVGPDRTLTAQRKKFVIDKEEAMRKQEPQKPLFNKFGEILISDEDVRKEGQALRKELELARVRFHGGADAAEIFLNEMKGMDKTVAILHTNLRRQAAIADEIANVDRAIQATRQTRLEQEVANDLAAGRFSPALTAKRQELINAEVIKGLKEQSFEALHGADAMETFRLKMQGVSPEVIAMAERVRDINKKLTAERERVTGLFESGRQLTEQLNPQVGLKKSMSELTQMLSLGAIDQRTYNKAIADTAKQVGGLRFDQLMEFKPISTKEFNKTIEDSRKQIEKANEQEKKGEITSQEAADQRKKATDALNESILRAAAQNALQSQIKAPQATSKVISSADAAVQGLNARAALGLSRQRLDVNGAAARAQALVQGKQVSSDQELVKQQLKEQKEMNARLKTIAEKEGKVFTL